MQDLFELHKEVLASVDNGTITVEEAEVLYDEMFEEQVNSLILDVYEAYDEGAITVGECNEYLTTIAEAAKGDKLDKKEEKKIDKELDNVPENERKVIEDSIKKASKETKVKKAAAIAGGAAATALALKAIDNGIKDKKRKDVRKDVMKRVRSEKDVKESADDILDLDAELALFEKSNIDAEDIRDIAIIGTVVTLITAPFVYTIGKTIKFNTNFKKANKHSKECTKIAREIEDLRDEANKKVDELNKKYKALYKKAPVINKYYIPKNKKDEMNSLKNQFAELKDKYDSKVSDLEEKYKKAYRAYQDSLQNTM